MEDGIHLANSIFVTHHSDLPVYRQIVSQLAFMIEMGQLKEGERLPSARLLADNLHINRNTVAHAYAELRDRGLLESKGRNGMVVVGSSRTQPSSVDRDRAAALLESAVAESMALGLTAAEVHSLAVSFAARAHAGNLEIVFVECNSDRAKYFASEIEAHVGTPVRPLVLGAFEPADESPDLVLTTFFHLAEVRKMMRRPRTEVVGLVVGPHVQTLVQISQVPRSRSVGICYSTEEQAVSIRDSLTQSGFSNISVLRGTSDEDLQGVDLVVVPSEMPELRRQLEGRVRVVEFGNILDHASVHMVADVVRELRLAKSGRNEG